VGYHWSKNHHTKKACYHGLTLYPKVGGGAGGSKWKGGKKRKSVHTCLGTMKGEVLPCQVMIHIVHFCEGAGSVLRLVCDREEGGTG